MDDEVRCSYAGQITILLNHFPILRIISRFFIILNYEEARRKR